MQTSTTGVGAYHTHIKYTSELFNRRLSFGSSMVLGVWPRGLARLTLHTPDTIMAWDVRWYTRLLSLPGDFHPFLISDVAAVTEVGARDDADEPR